VADTATDFGETLVRDAAGTMRTTVDTAVSMSDSLALERPPRTVFFPAHYQLVDYSTGAVRPDYAR
jgi:hypothetical protein